MTVWLTDREDRDILIITLLWACSACVFCEMIRQETEQLRYLLKCIFGLSSQKVKGKTFLPACDLIWTTLWLDINWSVWTISVSAFNFMKPTSALLLLLILLLSLRVGFSFYFRGKDFFTLGVLQSLPACVCVCSLWDLFCHQHWSHKDLTVMGTKA